MPFRVLPVVMIQPIDERLRRESPRPYPVAHHVLAAGVSQPLDRRAGGHGRAARRPHHALRRGRVQRVRRGAPVPRPGHRPAGRAVPLRGQGLLLGDADRRAGRGGDPARGGPARAGRGSGLRGRAPDRALRLPHLQERPPRGRAPLPRGGSAPGRAAPGPHRVHRAARVPVPRGAGHGDARRDQGRDDHHRGAARGAAPGTLGPAGALETPGNGRTARLPVPEASTVNTPADTGALPPARAQSWYSLPAGTAGSPVATNTPPAVACHITRARAPGAGGRPARATTWVAGSRRIAITVCCARSSARSWSASCASASSRSS